MDKFKNDIVHIIPYDLGFAFYDELAINNSKSYEYISTFIKILYSMCSENNIELYNNIEVKNYKTNDFKFIDTKICSRSICYAKLSSELYCYILSSGVAVFVLCDFNAKSMDEKMKNNLSEYNPILISGYQKVISQKIILDENDNSNVLFEQRKLMILFKRLTWQAVLTISKRYKGRYIRRVSSNSNYKHNGFSYVLSIYLLNSDYKLNNSIKHLLYSSTMNQILDESNWKMINDSLNEITDIKEYKVTSNKYEAHFSWSAVALISPKNFDNFDDILNDYFACSIIKSEIYVQSRWFLGDNTLDNFKLDNDMSLEKIAIVQNILEFTYAELDSATSANMTSFYKKMVSLIIETSEIRPLYRSVINQIKIQNNLAMAKNEDAKKKSLLITNILMAVFTAMSLYKSIMEFKEQDFSTVNVCIFGGTLIFALGIVIFNYIINRK